MAFPKKAKYVIIGAGIHGLSTAWHLAKDLKTSGKGSEVDVIFLDRSQPRASGIACSCVRSFCITGERLCIPLYGIPLIEIGAPRVITKTTNTTIILPILLKK